MKRAFHRIFFLLMCSSVAQSVSAQIDTIRYEKETPQNFAYAELGGSGYLLSLNYERQLIQMDDVRLNARIGVGSALFINAVPTLGINMCYGKRNHFLEVGMNVIRTHIIEIMGGQGNMIMANPILGYRAISPGGFFFRATFSPFFPLYDPEHWVSNDIDVFPYAGLSFGYAFR